MRSEIVMKTVVLRAPRLLLLLHIYIHICTFAGFFLVLFHYYDMYINIYSCSLANKVLALISKQG